jgi:predicted amidohydrolase
MRVYCCQSDIVWENKVANFARVRAMLHDARLARGAMVVLPEMFATGFSPDLQHIAEDQNGPTGKFLEQMARELGVCITAGVVVRDGADKMHNRAVVYDASGTLVASYAKLHPFRPGGEKTTPGDQVVTFACGPFTAAPFVCYDLRFPEIFRHAVRRGAELLLVLANWPTSRLSHWTALLQARAIENQAYVAGVNRCGSDLEHVYGGKSMIVDPRGQILAQAQDGAVVLGADIDLEILRVCRREFPALTDVRDQFLGSLA